MHDDPNTNLSKPDYPYRGRKVTAMSRAHDRSLKAAMQDLACIATRQASAPDRRACKLAMDWLNTLQVRLAKAGAAISSVHTLEVTSVTADSDGDPVPGTEKTEIFAWNVRAISDTDAMKIINSGMGGFSDRIARLTPEQARNLFPGQIEIET